MKYCSHCGNQVEDQAVICVKCGCSVAAHTTEPDVPSAGLNIISFLLPVVGLILYILYHEKAPMKAKEIGKWTIIGVCVSVVLGTVGYWFM